MGEPTEPGQDQETTVVIEGPPKGADSKQVESFNATFESFKREMGNVLKKYHPTLKSRLRKIEYVKKEDDPQTA